MFETLFGADMSSALSALGQVLMIDLVLAGDNAVAVGLAAAGLPLRDRRRAILAGLIAAVVLRIVFALITTQLLAVIGLLLAGGVLLLWVCWRMWRDLRSHGDSDDQGESLVEDAMDHPSSDAPGDAQSTAAAAALAPKGKTFRNAFTQILIADVSMSLDNVLAVAGAAREHPGILVFGLLLSIALMGFAATYIARLLSKHRWIGYIGLVVIVYVALHMIWDGSRDVACDTRTEASFNRYLPDFLDITPDQCRAYRR